MIELKPLDNAKVTAEIAQLFLPIAHLTPDECMQYLLTKLTQDKFNNLESTYTTLKQIDVMFEVAGAPDSSYIGCGTIQLLQDFTQGDLMFCQEYLKQLVFKLSHLGNRVKKGTASEYEKNCATEAAASIGHLVGFMLALVKMKLENNQ